MTFMLTMSNECKVLNEAANSVCWWCISSFSCLLDKLIRDMM